MTYAAHIELNKILQYVLHLGNRFLVLLESKRKFIPTICMLIILQRRSIEFKGQYYRQIRYIIFINVRILTLYTTLAYIWYVEIIHKMRITYIEISGSLLHVFVYSKRVVSSKLNKFSYRKMSLNNQLIILLAALWPLDRFSL